MIAVRRYRSGLAIALATWSMMAAGCVGAGSPATGQASAAEESRPYSGWYMESEGRGRLQLCGESRALAVEESGDLRRRARAFGLAEDTPVYVRITGTAGDGRITVARVDQFGSPTPVRDCPMTGVVIPEPD